MLQTSSIYLDVLIKYRLVTNGLTQDYCALCITLLLVRTNYYIIYIKFRCYISGIKARHGLHAACCRVHGKRAPADVGEIDRRHCPSATSRNRWEIWRERSIRPAEDLSSRWRMSLDGPFVMWSHARRYGNSPAEMCVSNRVATPWHADGTSFSSKVTLLYTPPSRRQRHGQKGL